jgi:CheY-like chemotaxis protein
MAGEVVLVVDDNPINAKLVRIILEEAELVVHVAVDAEDALRQLESFEPSVILMDLQLPGMDGLDLTRLLREQPRFEPTWIVALTAYAMKGDDEKALAAGCDAYVTKPIDTEELPRMVANYVSKPRR